VSALVRHPDRLFPADATTRSIARELYATVADAPIYSPHGHVEAAALLRNESFGNPTRLFISPDHYLTRILHGAGIPLEALGVGGSHADGRAAWRLLCENWDRFLGTPVRYWLEDQLSLLFGVSDELSGETADRSYDELSEKLADAAYLPQALFERFNIRVLATTDDPADDLDAHRRLRESGVLSGAVIPTFRADVYMNPGTPAWSTAIARLAASTGLDCSTWDGLLEALRSRRSWFRENGGTSTDTGSVDAWAVPTEATVLRSIHARAVGGGTVTDAEADVYRRDMLYRLAGMAADDGMVMQLHVGVLRNHHEPTRASYGPDSGHDLPLPAEFSRPLQRMLNDFGESPRFRVVLFTLDETAFGRDIAPLAGFYPSVFVGAPWWFLDTPDAMRRFRATVTDAAGFAKTSGFIDDTRALCSIPSRHDASRRVDAGYLAQLVAEHRLGLDDARTTMTRLVSHIPRSTFRLPG
jgi:glucuronate isomerase